MYYNTHNYSLEASRSSLSWAPISPVGLPDSQCSLHSFFLVCFLPRQCVLVSSSALKVVFLLDLPAVCWCLPTKKGKWDLPISSSPRFFPPSFSGVWGLFVIGSFLWYVALSSNTFFRVFFRGASISSSFVAYTPEDAFSSCFLREFELECTFFFLRYSIWFWCFWTFFFFPICIRVWWVFFCVFMFFLLIWDSMRSWWPIQLHSRFLLVLTSFFFLSKTYLSGTRRTR